MAITSPARKQQAALQRRIRWFYQLLNRGDFTRCHQMIDPCVRDQPGSVTLFQYQNALHEFMDRFGPFEVHETQLSLHLNEPNELYEGRDFAVGRTVLSDKEGEQHVFLERWVRKGRAWYTRATGFVTPQGPQRQPPVSPKRVGRRSNARPVQRGGSRGLH